MYVFFKENPPKNGTRDIFQIQPERQNKKIFHNQKKKKRRSELQVTSFQVDRLVIGGSLNSHYTHLIIMKRGQAQQQQSSERKGTRRWLVKVVSFF